jgi:hypothetical protein
MLLACVLGGCCCCGSGGDNSSSIEDGAGGTEAARVVDGIVASRVSLKGFGVCDIKTRGKTIIGEDIENRDRGIDLLK